MDAARMHDGFRVGYQAVPSRTTVLHEPSCRRTMDHGCCGCQPGCEPASMVVQLPQEVQHMLCALRKSATERDSVWPNVGHPASAGPAFCTGYSTLWCRWRRIYCISILVEHHPT